MRYTELLSTAVVLHSLATCTQAYVIDDTCNDYMDIIKDAVDCAFGMAELARIELNRAPMASHIDQIYTWIFRDTSLPQNPAIEEVHLDYLRKTFQNVVAFANPSTDKTNKRDVVIYCKLDRFKPIQKNNQGLYKDPDRDDYIDPDGFRACDSGINIFTQATQGWTFYGGNPLFSSALHLCEWYLKWAKGQKYKTSCKTPKGMWSNIMDFAGSGTSGRTAIDVFGTMPDVVLLHELTHAVKDNKCSDSKNSYGWQNIRKFDKAKAFTNADSVAYFGLATSIILGANGKESKAIGENGAIV